MSAFEMRIRPRQTIGILTFVFLSSLWCDLPGQEVINSSGLFPLSEGTKWTYQGVVRWSHENSNDVSETQVTWTTEVEQVIRREHLTAAVIRGFPSDLNWSDGNPEPANTLLVALDRGEYYLLQNEEIRDSLKRLQNTSDSLHGFPDPDDGFLRSPLAKGKKFCDPDGMARDDDMYCWAVNSVESVSLTNVKGLAPKRYEVYEMGYRTNPDDITLQLLPGVGVIRYQYHHHGTVAETDVKLVAFHTGAAGN